MNRRLFFATLVAAIALSLLPSCRTPVTRGPRYRIAVCDWMILKRQKLGAFPLAKELGADGGEGGMGSLGDRPTFESQLGDPAMQKQFLATASELGLGISSIAMSGFYAQSFAERASSAE